MFKLRLPMSRTDLQVRRHWVWNSFKAKVKKISAIMILSGHIINFERLQFRLEDDNLLNFVNSFTTLSNSDDSQDCDGNYVVVDTTRSLVIRSGAAEVGIMRRWQEHSKAFLLKEHKNRTNKFYSSYPSQLVTDKDLLDGDHVKGTFEDLSVRVGIGMKRKNKEQLVSMFQWNHIELGQLISLTGTAGRTSLIDKQYRHLCYMFELAYALAIEPSKNISYFGR